MAVLQLQLLGGFQARLGSRAVRLPRKAQALLAYLALAPGAQAPRASLATRFWGEGGEDDARNNLRQVLFRIRRSLGTASGALALEGDTVALDTALIETDALTFQRLATRGEEASLAEAAELYRGDLLEGLDVGEPSFDEWLRGERERLRQLGIDVLSRFLAKDLERGRREAAIQTALRLLALDPLLEDVHQTLMRAYAGEGRRTAALRQYQICVDALQRELQVEPEPGTRTLYLDILRQPRPRAASAPPMARPVPPRGFGGSPLIGRDAEMTRIRQELAGAGRRGGRIVALLGEAGVGKTRILQQVMAEAAASGWVVLEGRGHETEQGLPFALWVGACRSAGVIDDARIRGLAPPWREPLTTLFREIAAEHGRPRGRRSEDQLRLSEALLHLVHTLAAGQPLLLALEDLHWADAASLRLLAFIGRRLAESRVSVVVTARLEEGDVGAGPLGSVVAELAAEGMLVELSLLPLPRRATLQLIDALAPRGHRTAETIDRIWRMSEGNPFVVAEAVRAMGQGPAADTGADLSLPEGVRRLILTRVERLSADARDLAAVASIVGRDFEYALVRDAAGMPDADAAGALEELVRRRILQQAGDGFEFTHDRLREAVLGSLLMPRRRRLHEAVARGLLALHAADLDEHLSALAMHCREAERWTEAIDYLSRASMVAAARGTFREAVALLDRALDLLGKVPAGPERSERAADLRLALADRAMVLGEFGRVEQCLLEVLELAAGDERRTALARAILAHRDYNVRNYNRGAELAAAALTAAERLGDRITEARAAFVSGAFHMSRGEHPAAIADFEHAIRAAGDDPMTMLTIGLGLCHVAGRAWLAMSLAELGRFEEAMPFAHEAVARADAARNIFSMAWSRAFLGRVHLAQGSLEPAMAALVESNEMIDRYELGLIRRMCVTHLGHAHVLGGSAATALDFARRGPRTWSSPRIAESEALLAGQRLDEAEVAAVTALGYARDGVERSNEAVALALLAEVHERRGAFEAARSGYGEALAIASALGLRPRAAHFHRGLGRVLWRMGERDAAREQLEAALRHYTEMGMTRWIEPTRAELGQMGAPAAARRV